MLAPLFDADRDRLLTRLVLDAVESFDIDLSTPHNDSTSIERSGASEQADGHTRGSKSTPAVRHGVGKDHRPGLEQLVSMLTGSADGAVPIAARVADGNAADVATQIGTWDELVALTGNVDWLYVADSKLATFDYSPAHSNPGRPVPVSAVDLPA